MAKASPIQSNFNGGEFSPLVQGRVDSDRYSTGLDTCKNWIPTIQGGLTRRPGSTFVAEAGGSSASAVRLVSFEFSTTQAYIIEFGDAYIRFFKDNGQVLTTGPAIYEIVLAPYDPQDLFELKFTQSADVLYITHKDYAPRKLMRFADDDWELQVMSLLDGPYLNTNTTHTMKRATAFTLTPSAATGVTSILAGPSVTITNATSATGKIKIEAIAHGYTTGDPIYIAAVTGTTEANGTWIVTVVDDDNVILDGSTFTNAYISGGTTRPGLFYGITAVPGEQGALVRVKEGSVWGWGELKVITNAAQATINIRSTLTNTSAKTTWRIGAFYPTNYPSCSVFHEDRLFLSGSTNNPQRIDGSNSGDYENFAPSDTAGTITTANALSFTLNSNDVNAVKWLTSDEKGLLAGTVGSEWIVRPSSQTEALSSTNISAKRTTSFGSADIQAIQVGKSSIFIQRAGRKLRELTYFYDVDGFQAPDISILAEHITASGIKCMAFQKEPQTIVWAVLQDGTLVGMTYERSIDGLKVGFHRHTIGGVSNAAGDPAEVESVAVIPSADGTRDEVWISVKRYIDGAVVRHIEYLNKLFDRTDRQYDAKFSDASLTRNTPIVVSDITQANPAVVTATGHGLASLDKVIFQEIPGMTEVNGSSYTITVINANSFSIDVDSTAFDAYETGATGYVYEKVSSLSGLDHLEGEEVAILGDGAVQTNKTVTGGAITLDNPAGVITVGLPYESDMSQLRLESGAQDGTSFAKYRRTHRVGALFERTLGIKVGKSFDEMDRLVFRNANDPAGQATPLFSGIWVTKVDFGYDYDNQVHMRCDQPLPATILAIMPQLHTQDDS